MRRCWSAWACSAAVACGAGCGSGRVAQAPAVPAAVWRANARQVVEQLRAAALFERAAQHDDPDALVRATREAGRAQSYLVRAMLVIRR